MNNRNDNLIIYLAFGAAAYVMVVFFSLHAGHVLDTGAETEILPAVIAGFEHLKKAPFDFLPATGNFLRALGVLTGASLFGLFAFFTCSGKEQGLMPGRESGSACWNSDVKGFSRKYSDPIGVADSSGPDNMILSQNVRLSMDSFRTGFNNNVLVIGGSGSGKSRYFVKPNILQANCNYIVTDPAGELLSATGSFLEKQGYEVKVFNITEMSKSNTYNPFRYIRSDEDVLTMIDCLIANTTPPDSRNSDQFWIKSETALLQALCFYLREKCPVREQNFCSVVKMLRLAEVDENNSAKKSRLDEMFDELGKENPGSLAYKQYMTYRMGAGKTLKSILISVGVRLTPFNIPAVANLTSSDDIGLDRMAEGKKAVFVITPQASASYNFLVSMLYSQLFETLYYVADTGAVKSERPVRFLLDEFVNIGQIPQFTRKLATMRKYGISCSIVIQNIAQFKPVYDDWETIIGNCDTLIYLGGQEYSTLEYISNILGKQTITVKNHSKSRGRGGGSQLSFNRSQRSLMNPDEIGNMDNTECIVKIRSVDPFLDRKYDYTKHPRYRYTGDADESLKYRNRLSNTPVPDHAGVILNEVSEKEKGVREKAGKDIGKLRSEPMSGKEFEKLLNSETPAEVFAVLRPDETYGSNKGNGGDNTEKQNKEFH